MNTTPTDPPYAAPLYTLAEQVLRLARDSGAHQAEVSLSQDTGFAANVRLGEVETVERTNDQGVAVTVYMDQRKGTASTADLRPESLRETVAQACAIARYTEADPASGLADAERMATRVMDFDLWHPAEIDAGQGIALALACEAAGLARDGISNSDGASFSSGRSTAVYANSHGFFGAERSTHYSLSCSLIAGKDQAMQRDYWYSTALAFDGLDPAEAIGRKAAERTAARLNPRSVKTGQYPVLFAPELARGLIGSFLGAVSGGSLYRHASFLQDSIGRQIFPEWVELYEDPHIVRGFRSAYFDAEGVATAASAIVAGGVIRRYLLGSYSARRLGLQSTGNAGGVHNLRVTSNAGDLPSLIKAMGTGLLVTELMGQGVNTLTGDYSRGAAGFWVENGEIQYAVDELTVAGNLAQMLPAIEAIGSDIDTRSHIRVGSILVGKMTVAGND
ncbi:PmbA protein [Arenimonas maotaiensis]|uniref:PmbA protein n=1 Tax=Arenimonas maotaiensis TaxID=1446479 RepID=A0A917CFU9_9GAMM|nr:metalloprotease PmbA [Arenimonas maotaiensis]GGF84134.1 PmbA protein [Arenimonas maotaiensis]